MGELNLNVGTDPEFALVGPNKKMVPPHFLGFGDKEHKSALGMGKAFRDGYNIEVNVEPAKQRMALIHRVQSVLRAVTEKLPKGYRLITMPAYRIDLDTLNGAPSDLLSFGCDPSLNAYTGEISLPDLLATEHEWRYSGAHIHVSEDNVTEKSNHWCNNFAEQRKWAKHMDLYVGLPLTCLYHAPSQYLRRQYYGRAGEFRHQHYPTGAVGLEYRTPGPELFNDVAVADLFFGVALWVWKNHEMLSDFWDVDEHRLQTAIDTGTGRLALLRDVIGFYSATTIRFAAREQPFFKFNLMSQEIDLRNGWYSWQAKTLGKVKTGGE